MTRAISVLLCLGLLAATGVAAGFPRAFQEQAATMDSLRAMPRWEQVRWLAKRGLPDPYLRDCTPVQDSGLRCVGRWSYGPSTWVDIRATPTDTIVFLSRGSGVSIVRFRSHDSLRLDLLSDINSRSLTGRCQVRDSFLFVNSGGVECYNVSNLSQPVLLNWLSQPLIYDFFVVDTLLYTSSRDSFRVFSVANPASPRSLGACADSGYVMHVSGNYAYLGHQSGLFILDVRNPAEPHRVSTLGYDVLSISVRDTLLYFGTTEFALRVYNVADPATPFPIGSLSGVEAHDLYLPPTCDTVLYTPKLHVINIADPSHPRQIGFANCPGWDYGVRAVPALNCALVADYFDGLVAVDISSPTAPFVDTSAFGAGSSEDIWIDNGKAYVAQYYCGMRILEVTDPLAPRLLGAYDTAGQTPPTRAIVARDSFAYFGWTWPPYLHSFGVTNPSKPVMYGGADITNPPEDIMLRDSLLYVAEIARFQIVNIARPREPVLVGSCGSQDGVYFGLTVQDTLAYLISGSLQVIDVADPTSPTIIGTTAVGGHGIAVRDTFVYVPYGYDTLRVYSAANPRSLRLLGFAPLRTHTWDVALAESTAVVATFNGLEAFSLEDPVHPQWRAAISTPYGPRRVVYAAPYFYTAMWEAGVAIYETTSVGISERPAASTQPTGLRIWPNVTGGKVRFAVGAGARAADVAVFDISGKRLRDVALQNQAKGGAGKEGMIDLTGLAAGVYVVRVESERKSFTTKVVKLNRR